MSRLPFTFAPSAPPTRADRFDAYLDRAAFAAAVATLWAAGAAIGYLVTIWLCN